MADQSPAKGPLLMLSGLIILAAASRLLPHWPNFTALAAMGLFAGSRLADKRLAFLLPLVALWVSDVILNNLIYAAYVDRLTLVYPGMLWVYAAVAAVVALGMGMLHRLSIMRVAGAAVLASAVFFLVSNFGVWLTGALYPLNASGLLAAYVAALPFFGNTLAGNLFYCAVLFGALWVNGRPRSHRIRSLHYAACRPQTPRYFPPGRG